MNADVIMAWEDNQRCYERIMAAGATEVREASKYRQLLGSPKPATVPGSH